MAWPSTPLVLPYFSAGYVTAPGLDTKIATVLNQLMAGTAKGMIGETSSASTVTLSTTNAFAGLAVVTFTLATQRRVKISVLARYSPAGATNARYQTQAGYNTGSSAAIGSFVGVGQVHDLVNTIATNASGIGFGTALLAAGTYTAYASVKRITNGSATDTAGNPFYTLVEDIGST